MSETIYPEGIRCFDPRDGAPDYVAGTIIIEPNELITWLKSNQGILKDYQGRKQLRLSLLRGSRGLYTKVDTFEPQQAAPQSAPMGGTFPNPTDKGDGLPF